ncbi:MAG: tryptophan synthase subunit alpha [Muribaculum sp.]|nr:tryptophan synthase subunit alpha [Muribaculaceae bacterium]MCM1081442.1 tryptophan synthase subunit alpha [Muribaculum sp.]
MNRLEKLFSKKNKDILSIYFTAGYPTADSVAPIISELSAAGVDMIEVGMPFSDPMADGPVIQHSSAVALSNGMTLGRLLDEVEQARRKSPDTVLVLMGYLNPMMQFGFRPLFERCASAGVDALIVPDLPLEEYMAEVEPLSREFDIPVIMLVTPETSAERIRQIDNHTRGFIYMVSAPGTTGTRTGGFSDESLAYFKRVKGMNLRNPLMIGFGISNTLTFGEACENARGAIIGSLFIKALGRYNNINNAIADLLRTINRNQSKN